MAHKEQHDFCVRVKDHLPNFFRNKKVLDIGSLDINGNNRSLFENCNYIGLDVGEGRNVDVVSVGHKYDAPNEFFDVIISTEVFEHDMFYEETIKNIIRMLKPGGLFIFTCAAPGRPEHGTRRLGENCAPLLIQISEEWADYYKNLTEQDIRKINSFNEVFPDGHFELNNIHLEIPADLYFYGIKGGEKYLCDNIALQFTEGDFNDHIFVIDSWPNNESKEDNLLRLIKTLKVFDIPILLTGHYPIKPEIQKMVDYYLYDKNNPLLIHTEFFEHAVASGRWTETDEYKIENSMEFHHDYAIWVTMRNAFNFCKVLNKKFIHFLEYDNIPDAFQYKQSFVENIPYYDAVLYEYHEGSIKDTHLNPFCATFIFSIKTDIALAVVNQITSKAEYFMNKPKGWQLERVFLDKLTQITKNIHISEYIANNNELNTQAVWNRDGIYRNGAVFQCYLAVSNYNELYIHLISGFHEKVADSDYILEVNYGSYNKFITLRKGEMLTEKLGTYNKGKTIRVYHRGIEVFNEFLGYNVEEFRELNKITMNNSIVNPPKINFNFIDGPFIEINDDTDCGYVVDFVDKKTGEEIYTTKIRNNWWSRCDRKRFVDWRFKITSEYNHVYNYDLTLENQNVLISFESKSLGDNLAWIPYVEEFRKKHKCVVYCSTFFNDLFSSEYPDIKFVTPGVVVNNLMALYRLGIFYKDDKFDPSYHIEDPKKIPLMKIASDILGLEYIEQKPKLPVLGVRKEKRVCIAIHSTAQCKYWNNPFGWQEVVNFLKGLGYEVRLLSMEEDGYMGNKNPQGVTQQPKGSVKELIKVLQESELFIGVSSGLSWLAWAAGVETVLISGFTNIHLEPTQGIHRIINKNVCHGCWHTHKFDAGDWNWCPLHKDTVRQFECSKTITSEQVINTIINNKLIKYDEQEQIS